MLAGRDAQIKKEEEIVQKDIYFSTMKRTKRPFLQVVLDQVKEQDKKTIFDLSVVFLQT